MEVNIQQIIEGAPNGNQAAGMEQLQRVAGIFQNHIEEQCKKVVFGRPQGALKQERHEPVAYEFILAMPNGTAPKNNRVCLRCNMVGIGHKASSYPLRSQRIILMRES